MQINLSKIKQKHFYWILIVFTFIIYGNAINNEYALDDTIVVEGNERVEKGFSAITEIFTTHHAIDHNQSYGYRPLVLLTFAIEKQFFKHLPPSQSPEEKEKKDKLTQANISHFINVLLYAITCVLLFSFLVQLLPSYHYFYPFLITLLFLVHPLHTEPVCNLKSRDELLVLIGILLTLKFHLKFLEYNKYKYLILALLCSFIAFMSKQSSLSLLGLTPVVLYFRNATWKKIILSTLLMIIPIAIFILMKRGLIDAKGERIIKYFENPLKYSGDNGDRFALAFYSALFYLKMLLFPKNLSFYYGYNQIPIPSWSNIQVWISVLVFVPLSIYGVIKFLKRDLIGLGLAWWLGLMLGLINLFFPIVGIVADRFTYVFSVGFCVFIVALVIKLFKLDTVNEQIKISFPKPVIIGLAGVLLLSSFRVIKRNSDWENHLTLYRNDVEHLDQSAKAHSLLANNIYPFLFSKVNTPEFQTLLNEAIHHYKRAIEIDSTYQTCYNNLGSAYINFKGDYVNGIYYCSKGLELDSNHVESHFNIGYAYHQTGKYDKALQHYLKVVSLKEDHARVYNFIDNLVVKNKMHNKAILKLENISKKVSNPKSIYLELANLHSLNEGGKFKSLEYFIKAYKLDNTDVNLCKHIMRLAVELNQQEIIREYSNYCP